MVALVWGSNGVIRGSCMDVLGGVGHVELSEGFFRLTTTMYHRFYMIDSCIIEFRSHYSFDIVTSMGMPPSSIYMSHIICISPIDGNHINTKTKSHHVLNQEAPPLPKDPMMFVGHTMSSYPHTSGDNLLTQKIPQWALHDLHHLRTSMHNPHLTPTPSKRLNNIKRGLKTPKKSQNSFHRG